MSSSPSPARPDAVLPRWRSVLAVVAHPDDESFGLGAILDAFVRSGTVVRVLCLTHGEASTVHGISGDLATLRAAELQEAARALGATSALLLDHPDGALADRPAAVLEDVLRVVVETDPDGIVVFDPSGITSHPDHIAATAAALAAAESRDLPVIGWTLPAAVADTLAAEGAAAFVGHSVAEIDLVVPVDRTRQRIACMAHASQAIPTSVLWRRLELLGDLEHLRWLRRVTARRDVPTTEAAPEVMTMRVDYRAGDRFDVAVRGHVITVDQPEDVGGEDLGPTPTELFVAGLASCVAFYARRYLRRHKYDATGLAVEVDYVMAAKPARVGEVRLRISVPAELPQERREGLVAVASHCTVHNSITSAPEISVTLE